jgi:streptogramin lyase
MQEEQRCVAKGQMIAVMQTGHPWQVAAALVGVRIGRSGRTSIGTERPRLADECPIAKAAFPRLVIQANHAGRWRLRSGKGWWRIRPKMVS